MRLCPVCGVAASHNPQGGPCLACYRAGCARMVDGAPYRSVVRGWMAKGNTATDLGESLGCSRQAVMDLVLGRTSQIRSGLADAIDAHVERPQPCAVCEDVEVAAESTDDPQMIAARVGKTVDALHKHLYRHGRSDLGRMFNRHNREKADA